MRWDDKRRDIDLFVEFRPSSQVYCSVGFYNPLCEGVIGHFDDPTFDIEIATFNTLGQHKYLIYVGEYFDKN